MKRRIVMAGTTFFLAAATGHVMQNGDVIGAKLRGALASPSPTTAAIAAPSKVSKATTVAAVVPVATPKVTSAPVQQDPMAAASTPAGATAPEGAKPIFASQSASSLPEFPAAKVRPLASGTLLAARMDLVADSYARPETDADAEYSVFGVPCGPSALSLGLASRGTLRVMLSAPCHPAERVVFSHAGLSFAMLTDAAGHVEVSIPAMAVKAIVDAGFVDGKMLTAERIVPNLDTLRRVALTGNGELHLNAYENGAAFGADGHYAASRPGDAASVGGATVVTLGDADIDDPMIAEVYTASDAAKGIAIEAETEVTDLNCGRSVTARIMSMAAGTPVMRDTLSQSMPDCDAIGDMVLAPLPGWNGPLTVATAE